MRIIALLVLSALASSCSPTGSATVDVDALLDASPPDRVVLHYDEGAGMGPEAYHALVVFADGRVTMSDGPAWLLGADGSIESGVGTIGELRSWQLDRADLVDLLGDVLATGIVELPGLLEDRRPIMDGSSVTIVIATAAGTEHRVSAGNERPPALRDTAERIARLTDWEPVDFTVNPGP